MISSSGSWANAAAAFLVSIFSRCLERSSNTSPNICIVDSLVESYVAMGMDAASADAAIASLEGFWLAPQNIAIALAAAAALSIAGYALGMKMLGKHFKPAGVA